MQIITLADIFLIARSGEHDDGNMPQIGIGLDFGEHFPPVLFRQVQIQEDQVRLRCAAKRVPLAEIGHRFHAIPCDDDFTRNRCTFEGLLN